MRRIKIEAPATIIITTTPDREAEVRRTLDEFVNAGFPFTDAELTRKLGTARVYITGKPVELSLDSAALGRA